MVVPSMTAQSAGRPGQGQAAVPGCRAGFLLFSERNAPAGPGRPDRMARATAVLRGLIECSTARAGPGGLRPQDGVRHPRRRGPRGQRRELLDRAGRALGVVGESGSGKSVTMMSLMGLLAEPAGQGGGRLDPLPGARGAGDVGARDARRSAAASIGFVFQDPMTSLNPVFTVGYQLVEPLRLHLGLSQGGGAGARGGAAGAVGHPGRRRSGSTTTRTSSPAACASG